MARIRLIRWNTHEAGSRATELRRLGHVVNARLAPVPELVRSLAASPPAAIIIDLTRSPIQGRDLGILVRQRKATRLIPLVFAGGAPEKVARVRELLPDATFAERKGIAVALTRAITRPALQPVVHAFAIAADAGRPLVRRLGIKPGMRVALVGAPSDFKRTLEPLPSEVRLTSSLGHTFDLVLWFVRQPAGPSRGLATVISDLGKAHVWIAWPKGGSAVRGDLTQQVVRAQALAAGLVDHKI